MVDVVEVVVVGGTVVDVVEVVVVGGTVVDVVEVVVVGGTVVDVVVEEVAVVEVVVGGTVVVVEVVEVVVEVVEVVVGGTVVVVVVVVAVVVVVGGGACPNAVTTLPVGTTSSPSPIPMSEIGDEYCAPPPGVPGSAPVHTICPDSVLIPYTLLFAAPT